MSGNEVQLALEVGFPASEIFLNGSGKQLWELELAVENGCFINVDSVFDAENICRVASEKNKIVQVSCQIVFMISWHNNYIYFHYQFAVSE